MPLPRGDDPPVVRQQNHTGVSVPASKEEAVTVLTQDQAVALLCEPGGKRLRADRLSLTSLSRELRLSNLTHLYLQSNALQSIQVLGTATPALVFLAVMDNKLTGLDGVASLQSLRFLDASNNLITDVRASYLPPSLVIVNLAGNPCARPYRAELMAALPRLRELDDARVVEEEEEDEEAAEREKEYNRRRRDAEERPSGHVETGTTKVDAAFAAVRLDMERLRDGVISRLRARRADFLAAKQSHVQRTHVQSQGDADHQAGAGE